jgi:precorrin-2 dehydrogenase/sirohydrochlorin ferrochelatase
MMLYPLNLKVDGQPCTVIGGGKVAARKVATLLECGARVWTIAPQLDEDFEQLEGFVHVNREYTEGDLEGAFLVIAATDDEATNRAVQAEAHTRGIILNVVDQPERCDFYVPSSIRRGDLLLTVSSGGQLPALSKRLRRNLEEVFPEEWGRVLELLGAARAVVITKNMDENKKRQCLTELAGLDLVRTMQEDGEDAVKTEIDACISRYSA